MDEQSMRARGDVVTLGVPVDDVEDIPFYELVDGKLRPSTNLTAGERYGIRVAVALDRAKRSAEGIERDRALLGNVEGRD